MSATKRSPGATVRLSVLTPENAARGPIASPATAPAASAMSMSIGACAPGSAPFIAFP